MASTISEGMRKEFEAFIAKHEPYSDDDPELQYFDGNGDPDRAAARLMKKVLDGEL